MILSSASRALYQTSHNRMWNVIEQYLLFSLSVPKRVALIINWFTPIPVRAHILDCGCGIPQERRYPSMIVQEDAMEDTITCPACGTLIRSDSTFCRSCGKSIRKCPSCSSIILEGVMFCPNCETPLFQTNEHSETSPQNVDSETTHLIWEGVPFSGLQKTSQTKRQWRITVVIFATYAIACILMIAWIMLKKSTEDVCCISGFVIGLAFFSAFTLWVRYWVGRSGAEHEERKKWKDPL